MLDTVKSQGYQVSWINDLEVGMNRHAVALGFLDHSPGQGEWQPKAYFQGRSPILDELIGYPARILLIEQGE